MRMLCAVLLAAALPAVAAELRSVGFERAEDRYIFESEAWFDARVESMYAVLLDYDLSTEFSSGIVEARNLPENADGQRGFFVRNRGCVMFFCKSFERTGVIDHEPYREIRAAIDADASDFHFSDEVWQFQSEAEGTVIRYRAEFEPKFWVPPVIGPWIIRKTLESHGGDAINRIEAIAREHGE